MRTYCQLSFPSTWRTLYGPRRRHRQVRRAHLVPLDVATWAHAAAGVAAQIHARVRLRHLERLHLEPIDRRPLNGHLVRRRAWLGYDAHLLPPAPPPSPPPPPLP